MDTNICTMSVVLCGGFGNRLWPLSKSENLNNLPLVSKSTLRNP